MKRVDLVRHLEAQGCRLLREGGSHSVYIQATSRKESAGYRMDARPLAGELWRKLPHESRSYRMPQDRESGAAASEWGHETAKKIAKTIGATIPAGGSNECELHGDRIVIKCAAATTDQVGVTYNMLSRLKYVLGAFQREDDRFDLYALDPRSYDVRSRSEAIFGSSCARI